MRTSEIPLPEVVMVETIAKTNYPPIEYLIEGILPSIGLGILAGPPKCGTSWMALQIANAVSTGKDFAGYFPVEKTARVLYLALEDDWSGIKQRVDMLRIPKDADLVFRVEMPQGKAGLDALTDCVNRIRPGLVIVDKLQSFTGTRGRSGVSQDETDYHAIKPIARLADEANVAILLLHNTRKWKASVRYPFESIIGSNGLLVAADTLWVIKIRNGTSTGVLHTTGREIAEQSFSVQLPVHCHGGFSPRSPGPINQSSRNH